MKINFDMLHQASPTPFTPNNSSLIKVEIQSPIYEKISRSMSPYNYHHELDSIRDVINIPKSVNQFIAHQINKQIQSQSLENSIHEQSSFQQPLDLPKTLKDETKPKAQHKSKVKKHNPMSWVYKYKKHRCEQQQTTNAKKLAKQINQLTLKPKLIPCKTSKKIAQGRKVNTIMGKKYSVYDSLYKDATKREFKKLAKKQESSQTQTRTPHINSQFFAKNHKVYTPILQRLDEILERKEQMKKKAQNYDLTTGRQMFQPNLNSSRDSYKIYFHSLSKQKLKNVKNEQSIRELETEEKSNRKLKIKQKKDQDTIDSRVINFFVNLFYPNSENEVQVVDGLDSVKQKQFAILQPFLHMIQEIESKRFEQQTTVSSVKGTGKTEGTLGKEIFHEKFKKFYEGLTLYDKQILRGEIVNKKRQQIKIYQQQALHMNFKPTINIRSSSLDTLAKGHSHQIYFV